MTYSKVQSFARELESRHFKIKQNPNNLVEPHLFSLYQKEDKDYIQSNNSHQTKVCGGNNHPEHWGPVSRVFP